jgi:HK97 family phage portal protein
LFDALRSRLASWLQPQAAAGPVAMAEFRGPDDPRFKEWLRSALLGGAEGVAIAQALKVPAVQRAVDLLSGSIAMLPLGVVGSRSLNPVPLPDHPLQRVLHLRPNPWMSPFQFKREMMVRLLTQGRALALVARMNGRVTGLVPLWREQVRIEQTYSNAPVYYLMGPDGRERRAAPGEILDLRDMDYAGVASPSRVQ